MGARQHAPEYKLPDLKARQALLQHVRNRDFERGERVVEVHESVDQGVEGNKHPDGRGCGADPGPHGQHGAGVVVSLEERRLAALGEDDEGVEDLVELGEVEEVAVVREAVAPDSVFDITQGPP